MLVNGTAAVMLAALTIKSVGEVSWPHAGLMNVTGIAGSLSGSFVACRMSQKVVRRIVAAIGFGLPAYCLLRE